MMVRVSRFPLAVSDLNDCFWLAYAMWILKCINKANGKVSPDQISQWISVLEPLSVASTIKFKWREQYYNDDRYKKIATSFGPSALKTIYFNIRQGDDFITQ
ncbi:MAG: hypothetical protein EZS28_035661 [Streblomastix strix]|uniref:Uncharacterized protein n=1 Tax=Streblomastix strix TaxID=222440 RepID=A0A5J4UG34_9EUKA|nr:MAG: hypothetical protein EZS28_035661 [Streblomastix strix]